jgi:hypothetical protein
MCNDSPLAAPMLLTNLASLYMFVRTKSLKQILLEWIHLPGLYFSVKATVDEGMFCQHNSVDSRCSWSMVSNLLDYISLKEGIYGTKGLFAFEKLTLFYIGS